MHKQIADNFSGYRGSQAYIDTVNQEKLIIGVFLNQIPRCKQRGINLAALQSSGVFDPRGIRQMCMQACPLDSLLAGIKIMRKDTREHLEQLELACELAKLIRHFFPGLVPLLKKLPDPRNQSYTTYPGAVLLMTRILSSIFYISSMRKTSEEFNSDTVIENVWSLCGEEPAVDELPYWEAIDHYLKRMDPCGL